MCCLQLQSVTDNAQLESFVHHGQLMELMDKSGCDLTLNVRFTYSYVLL